MSISAGHKDRYHKMASLRSIPRLLLFDVDGTLMNSSHADSGFSPLVDALSNAFNFQFNRRDVEFCGKTDPQICRELIEVNGLHPLDGDGQPIDEETLQKQIMDALENIAHCLDEGVKSGKFNYDLCPGIPELITALSDQHVTLGLLTGNHHLASRIKFDAVGLNFGDFRIGAFGSDNADRTVLPRIAMQRYEQMLGASVSYNDMVIIGDTPRDVQCAHVNNIPCVAVATGKFSQEELRKCGADVVLSDLSNTQHVIELLLNVQHN